MQISKDKKTAYISEIDFLRSLAVLAVILNHFSKKILPSGYLGVDIFFVISGFVITRSTINNEYLNFFHFYLNFIQKRIKRLLPALFTCVIITSLLICIFDPNPITSIKTGALSLIGISNIYLAKNSIDYFAEDVNLNPFMHTWSLGIESQFYFLFPIIFWFFSSRKAKYLMSIMIFLSTCSLINFLFFYNSNPTFTYYFITTRFWEIGFGVITYLVVQKSDIIKSLTKKIELEPLVFCLIILFFLPLSIGNITTVLVVLITSTFLLSISNSKKLKIIKNKFFLITGSRSYALYLWHWPILSISQWTIGISFYTLPFQLLAIILSAYLSYNFIENPFRHYAKINFKIIFFYITSFFSITIIFLLGSYKGKNRIFIGDLNYSQKFDYKDWLINECGSSRTGTLNEIDYQNCEFNKNNKLKNLENKLFIYGDSYVKNIIPNFINQKFIYPFNYYNSSYANGCLTSGNIKYSTEKNIGFCSKLYRNYIKFFNKNSNSNDYLMLILNYNFFSENLFGNHKLRVKDRIINNQEAFDYFKKELISLSNKLNKENKKLVVFSPIPILNRDPQKCNQFFSKYNSSCLTVLDKYNSDLKLINQSMIDISNNNFIYLNIYDELINVISKSKGYLEEIYRNKDHLTPFGSSLVDEFIFNELIGKKFKKN